jgi:hypothetical protein
MIRVTCLGGAGSVTGSSYLIENPAAKLGRLGFCPQGDKHSFPDPCTY